ncbi:hypothetical protein K491DRAFT_234256 [Lophiostoma macrostomum CBS 122681]|uniref:Uncharacterized protein n=1 Tax=Lophiostoma macrostomum CBS 122681 TaxID=1314788 RepID=A0A6A6TFV7_9PLEO|nr:hypothetical protein K491DRAFT_234256 [Lophiostoma macrostomum CBS 122681]
MERGTRARSWRDVNMVKLINRWLSPRALNILAWVVVTVYAGLEIGLVIVGCSLASRVSGFLRPGRDFDPYRACKNDLTGRAVTITHCQELSVQTYASSFCLSYFSIGL